MYRALSLVVSFNNGLFKSTFCSYLILATCFKLTSTQGRSAESPLLVSSGDSASGADSDFNDASHHSLLGRRKRFVFCTTRMESVSSLNYGGSW